MSMFLAVRKPIYPVHVPDVPVSGGFATLRATLGLKVKP
jgi:hypothetical protein